MPIISVLCSDLFYYPGFHSKYIDIQNNNILRDNYIPAKREDKYRHGNPAKLNLSLLEYARLFIGI